MVADWLVDDRFVSASLGNDASCEKDEDESDERCASASRPFVTASEMRDCILERLRGAFSMTCSPFR